MKILRYLLVAVLLTFATPSFTGCKLPPRTTEAIIFDSCKTTYNAAYNAYKATVKLHLAGKLTAAQRKQADDAWNDFRKSFVGTMKALTIHWDTATPEELQVIANNFIALLHRL